MSSLVPPIDTRPPAAPLPAAQEAHAGPDQPTIGSRISSVAADVFCVLFKVITHPVFVLSSLSCIVLSIFSPLSIITNIIASLAIGIILSLLIPYHS